MKVPYSGGSNALLTGLNGALIQGDAVRDAGMPLARAPVALLERLRERGPVMRRSELIDEDSLAERRSVDDLVREEDVQVFGVGEEVMVRLVEDDDPGSDA
jgi:hypothetical protein